jgi:hypothetical protein
LPGDAPDTEGLRRLKDALFLELDALNERLDRVERLCAELLADDRRPPIDHRRRRVLLSLRRMAAEYARAHAAVRDLA